MGEDPRKKPGVERKYRNDQIVVDWEPGLCIHVGNCLRGLSVVFNARSRPWVSINSASPDHIAEVVMTCPTGALHFERLDGGEQEAVPEEITITEVRNGPLYVRGKVKIVDQNGEVLREDVRVALCRCGHSDNKPFCDGNHWRVDFRTPKPSSRNP